MLWKIGRKTKLEIGWWLSLFVFLIGIAVFLRGFLLNRIELHEKTLGLCEPWSVEADGRVFILLVDALGYDFLERMPFIKKSLKEDHAHWRTVKFIADPPTTTMQRLKALLTGSMPTFVDIQLNFGAEEVLEDNLINQWKACQREVYFTGDDTWTKLFIDQFTVTNGYPSFNVRDLDTVDDGVKRFIGETINGNFSILIGHMLGIDHAGHTWGKYHPEMTRKVLETDAFIEHLSNNLREKDVLVIFGDHGMTSSGNHGGDTFDETEASFIIHSKDGFSQQYLEDKTRKGYISQIDSVPFLSYLTKVPVPYSNLGILPVSQEIFPSKKYQEMDSFCQSNFLQMKEYTKEYLTYSSNKNIQDALHDVEGVRNCSKENLDKFYALQDVYRENWTKMDMNDIICGILVSAIGFTLQMSFIFELSSKRLLFSSILLFLLIAVYISYPLKHFVPVFALLFLNSVFLFFKRFKLPQNFSNELSSLLYILPVLFFHGNSFIIQEMPLLVFIINTILFVRIITEYLETKKFSWLKVAIILLVRVSLIFEACREESLSSSYCYLPQVDDPDNAMIERETLKLIIAVMSALFSLIIFPRLLVINDEWDANLSPFSFNKISMSLMFIGWLFKTWSDIWPLYQKTQNDSLPLKWIKSVGVNEGFLLTWKTRSHCLSVISIVMSLFHNLLSKACDKDKKQFSSKLLKIIINFSLILIGQEMALAFTIFLILTTLIYHSNTKDNIRPHLIIFDYFLLSRIGFFMLSHQRTITNIPWLVVFTFYNESPKGVVIPATLVVLNLTITFILPLALHFIFVTITKDNKRITSKLSCIINNQLPKFKMNMRESLVIAITLLSLSVLSSIVALGILRRHLMVWKIFTPAFIYEFLFFSVTLIMILLVLLSKVSFIFVLKK